MTDAQFQAECSAALAADIAERKAAYERRYAALDAALANMERHPDFEPAEQGAMARAE